MLKFVARRGLARIPILLCVMLIALLLVELMPGDPAAIMAGENATPEAIALIRQELRVADPVWERFGEYVWDVLHGDLGYSPLSRVSVWGRISTALPATLSLAAIAMGVTVVVGVAAGTLAALKRGRLVDRAVTAAASVMQAVPPFVIALLLVIFFALDRKWFPSNGYVPFGDNRWEWLRHLILPGVALAHASAAELARQTRGALADVFEEDYIRAARAKGLPERWVIAKHAAKNAATPVVTVLGLQVGRILGGAVIVELMFGIHGFGEVALNAVVTRDVVLIQGVVLVSAIAVLFANLVVDLSYGYLNPRTRV